MNDTLKTAVMVSKLGVLFTDNLTDDLAWRKRMLSAIKAGGKGGKPGQWSARKAQMLAQRYKKAGGGYKN